MVLDFFEKINDFVKEREEDKAHQDQDYDHHDNVFIV